ncbi:conserved hypothetical protein [Neospora caninum Liverpool]|uniref:Peroxin-3, domain-containing n=1 Tax=Neospora caninum (strain Liverpool) TaxID=572307 RepID=F0VMI3_NEOCL|nr:conserved hypothetical protein [Neospora caninum Liverpool]CBZ54929.1 conserved hypothetical protein [Neospora caninum Liverpool]CEL69651.1 TPA: Peroxin-3, domain-containing [Neospora caninum Liverpool]|eukprot:XP_003884957.1 conserved hypothetical protein [Neospora caninum Liverpool]
MLTGTWNAMKRHKWKFLAGGSAAAGLAYLGRQVYVQYKQLSAMLEDTEDLDRLLAALLGLNPEELPADGSLDTNREQDEEREENEKRDTSAPVFSFSALSASLSSPFSSFLERLGFLPFRGSRTVPRASASAEWKMIAHFLRTQVLADRSTWELREEIRGIVNVAFDISHYTALLRDPVSARTLSPVAKRRCFFHMSVEVYARTLMAIYLLVLLAVLHRVQVNIVARQTFYGVYTPGFTRKRVEETPGEKRGELRDSTQPGAERTEDRTYAPSPDDPKDPGTPSAFASLVGGEDERRAEQDASGEESISLEEVKAANYLFLTTTRYLLSSQAALDLIAVEIHRATRQVLRDAQPEGILSSKDLLHLLLLILVTAHTRILKRAENGALPRKRHKALSRSTAADDTEPDEEEEEADIEGEEVKEEEEEETEGEEDESESEEEQGRRPVSRGIGLAALLLPEGAHPFEVFPEDEAARKTCRDLCEADTCASHKRSSGEVRVEPRSSSNTVQGAPASLADLKNPAISSLVEAQLAEARDLLEAPACAEATLDGLTASLWLAVQCLQGCLLQAGRAVPASPSPSLLSPSRASISLSSVVEVVSQNRSQSRQDERENASPARFEGNREERSRVDVRASAERTEWVDSNRVSVTDEDLWFPRFCLFPFARTFGRMCQLADFVLGTPGSREGDEAVERPTGGAKRQGASGAPEAAARRGECANRRPGTGDFESPAEESDSDVLAFFARLPAIEEFSSFAFFPTATEDELDALRALAVAAREKAETEETRRRFLLPLGRLSERGSPAFRHMLQMQREAQKQVLLAALREEQALVTRRKQREEVERKETVTCKAEKEEETKTKPEAGVVHDTQEPAPIAEPRFSSWSERDTSDAGTRENEGKLLREALTSRAHNKTFSAGRKEGEREVEGTKERGLDSRGESCLTVAFSRLAQNPSSTPGSLQEVSREARAGDVRPAAPSEPSGPAASTAALDGGCLSRIHASEGACEGTGDDGGFAGKDRKGEQGSGKQLFSFFRSLERQTTDSAGDGALRHREGESERSEGCAEPQRQSPSVEREARVESVAPGSPPTVPNAERGGSGDGLTLEEEGFLDCQCAASDLSLDVHLIDSRLSSRGPLDSWSGAEVSLSSFVDRRTEKRGSDRDEGDKKVESERGETDPGRGTKKRGACAETRRPGKSAEDSVSGAAFGAHAHEEKAGETGETREGKDERKGSSAPGSPAGGGEPGAESDDQIQAESEDARGKNGPEPAEKTENLEKS